MAVTLCGGVDWVSLMIQKYDENCPIWQPCNHTWQPCLSGRYENAFIGFLVVENGGLAPKITPLDQSNPEILLK